MKRDPIFDLAKYARVPIVITDPDLEDNPIVLANDAFLKLTGYEIEEVLGRNCRFLQGENTDKNVVEKISAAIAAGKEISIDILNYKKDGTEFINNLIVIPLWDPNGDLLYFAGFQLISE